MDFETLLITNAVSVEQLGFEREFELESDSFLLLHNNDFYSWDLSGTPNNVVKIVAEMAIDPIGIMLKIETGYATLLYEDPLTLEMINLPIVAGRYKNNVLELWVEN